MEASGGRCTTDFRVGKSNWSRNIDSDCAKNSDNQKSTSSYVFTYGDGAISWRSELQDYTELLTAEVEYIASSEAAKGSHLAQLIIGYFFYKGRIDHPAPTLYCDSQSAIHLVKNPVYHAKTKHIEVRYHHIRELVIDKKLEVRKVDTEVNIADSLTKPLLDQHFNTLREHMELQQESEQRRDERKAEGKSKNGTTREVEHTKSKELDNLKVEDAIKCEGTEKRSTIHQKVQERTRTTT